jgi:hypothetical protein
MFPLLLLAAVFILVKRMFEPGTTSRRGMLGMYSTILLIAEKAAKSPPGYALASVAYLWLTIGADLLRVQAHSPLLAYMSPLGSCPIQDVSVTRGKGSGNVYLFGTNLDRESMALAVIAFVSLGGLSSA